MSETTNLICAHCGVSSAISNSDHTPTPVIQQVDGMLMFKCQAQPCAASYPLFHVDAQPAKEAALQKLTNHKAKMQSDPEYAERMAMMQVAEGRKFTVGFTAKNPYETIAFFQSLFGDEKKQPLVAGCTVHRIDFHDMGVAFDALRQKVGAIIETSSQDLTELIKGPVA